MEELNISLQHISRDGMGISYYIVKLNVWYHMSFSVLFSSNIVCITLRFNAILSEKSGRGFSRFYFRDIKASAEESGQIQYLSCNMLERQIEAIVPVFPPIFYSFSKISKLLNLRTAWQIKKTAFKVPETVFLSTFQSYNSLFL